MVNEKVYFPNLNGLRFIAAAMVIVHHIEQLKSLVNLDSYWEKIQSIFIIGKQGVVLFFVLSGFLITYLLLSEEKNFKVFNIRKFYIRRILRIWPLYFLIIILSFFVLPNIDFFILPDYGKDVIYDNITLKLFLYAIFFPNLVNAYWGIIPYASQTWSIGTEEQFYLIWPLLLKWIKKYRIVLMVLIVVVYAIINQFFVSSYSDNIPFKIILEPFWTTFRIDCMAIGGLFAILLFKENKYILNKFLFYIVIVIAIVLLIKGIYFPYYIHSVLYATLFGIIIVNFAANKKIKISLENRLLNYLGSISYGLYMYHPIGIIISIVIAKSLNFPSNWIIYPLSFSITILMAGLSYKYFESFFLKFKPKFSIIKSGIV
ncbi:MAG: acyltransferase [Bacteroidota bacterium]